MNEVLAAIVVCFAQIPESVAFAALAHCSPAAGLHAAWIVGLVCALFGGRPGMVSGSAGALASVSAAYVLPGGVGVEELFLSVAIAGVLVLIAAAFGVGRFLPLVPATVMIGFCNGLAIVIGHAQLSWFTALDGAWLQGSALVYTIVHCFSAVLIMLLLPRITRKMPASLVAMIVGCLLEHFLFRGLLNSETVTIGDKSKFTKSETMPRLFFFDSKYDVSQIQNFRAVIMQSCTLAIVAVLESLMTLDVVDDLTRTRGEPNRHVWALGAANLLAGLFGTMGGNALIELSVMNVQAGGVKRASSTLIALGVLAIVLFASPALNYIPAGSLAGVMVTVVIDTARWSSLPAVVASLLPDLAKDDVCARFIGARAKGWLQGLQIHRFDAFTIVLVTVATAVTNLGVAVFSGMFFTSMRFAWQSQKPLEISSCSEEGKKTYVLEGVLFFASRAKIAASFQPESDPEKVFIDFAHASIYDFSVLYAFHPILEQYARRDIDVSLLNVPDAMHLHNLVRSGKMKNIDVKEHSAISRQPADACSSLQVKVSRLSVAQESTHENLP